MRVLIAEDDVALASFVRKGLEAEHYAVDVSHDGEQTRAMAGELDYDLLMLDLNLPRLDGVTILRHLRTRKPSMPILVLTGRNRVEDRVQCLDLGADDYLGKPFSYAELSARIRALLRRSHLPAASVLNVEDLKLDRVERRVERSGKRIELTSKEFSLLEYLMLNAGRRVTREMIIEHVWNLSFDTTTNVVDVYVNYLSSVRLLPFGGAALIQMDFALAFPLIDLLLGGEGGGKAPEREITEIEDQILETVMRIICRELQMAWQPLGLEFQFEQRQQASRVQHLLAADEKVLGLSFEIKMKESSGLLSIAVPAVFSNALLRKISVSGPRSHSQLGSQDSREQLRQRLQGCGFRVELDLGVTVTAAAELTALAPGKILGLQQRADGAARLACQGTPIFDVRIARVGRMRAAQVIMPVEEKVWQRT